LRSGAASSARGRNRILSMANDSLAMPPLNGAKYYVRAGFLQISRASGASDDSASRPYLASA
ncbi:MAG TPA: hypothetical protein VHH73_10885, partial [Verrucomicrobiae bacterium]|nr:hypothetical protein [Verrucomicrobiae bacterium]